MGRNFILVFVLLSLLSPVLQAQQQDTAREVSAGAGADTLARYRNVYIISVGISQYKGPKLKLAYASKDALDFSAALHAASEKLFNKDGNEHVFTYTYSTEPGSANWPTRENIKKPFEDIARQAGEDDILVIFFAGHGVTRNNEFYFLTQEASAFELAGVEHFVAISTAELGAWMRNIKAKKQLLILDACNSGQALLQMQEMLTKREPAADREKTVESLDGLSGTYILAASATSQAAYETSLYGQGLLTYSLLSGLKHGGALKNGFIDVMSWFNFAASNVSDLAKKIGGRQEPQVIGKDSLYLGIVDSTILEKIVVPEQKKIFKASNLRQQEVPVDGLELTVLVDRELNKLGGKDKESLFIFMADNTFIDAYSVAGNYEVKNDTITAKLYIVKGLKEVVHQFTVTESLSGKEALAKNIALQVKEFVAGIGEVNNAKE